MTFLKNMTTFLPKWFCKLFNKFVYKNKKFHLKTFFQNVLDLLTGMYCTSNIKADFLLHENLCKKEILYISGCSALSSRCYEYLTEPPLWVFHSAEESWNKGTTSWPLTSSIKKTVLWEKSIMCHIIIMRLRHILISWLTWWKGERRVWNTWPSSSRPGWFRL